MNVFACILVCVCVCKMHICEPGACGGQKTVSNPLEWLWTAMCVLGLEPRFSARARNTLNCQDISPAQDCIFDIVGFLELVTGSYELPYGCWEPSSGPLLRQEALLTAKPQVGLELSYPFDSLLSDGIKGIQYYYLTSFLLSVLFFFFWDMVSL